MPKFVFLTCSCGRALRAWEHQAGTPIRCWGCHAEMTVPRPKLGFRLVGVMGKTVREFARKETVLLALALASGITGALVAGRWGAVALAVALVAAAVVFRARLRESVSDALVAVRRHPLASLVTLPLVPVALVALEAGSLGFAYEQDWLRFLVFDVCPPSAAASVIGRRPDYGWTDYATISDREILAVYGKGLRRGYLLTWTVPASLPRGTALRADTGYARVNLGGWLNWVDPTYYTAFKSTISIAIFTTLALLLGLTARWLEVLAELDRLSDDPSPDRESEPLGSEDAHRAMAAASLPAPPLSQ